MPTTAQDADRYRRAAEETLDQLQWCIDYLYRIRKRRLADALAENCRTIRGRLKGVADD